MQLKNMNNSEFIHSFFLFLFLTIFTCSCSLNNIHKCPQEQSHALLLFKQNLSSFNDSKYGCYYPILKNWNTNSDCCDWDGVTCDHYTGDVIDLDLSCGMLRGTIHSNSSLFHLPRLRRLNLAFNNFTGSQIPHEIGMLSNTLSHFNISRCGFSGQIPSEISLLRNMVSLDVSGNYDFKLQSHVLVNLLWNFTVLEELSLAWVNISSVLPAYLNISSSLRLLNLHDTGLQGKLPHYIFNLRSLEVLDLSFNTFTGNIPSEITLLSKMVSLYLLDLSGLEIQPHIFLSFLQNSTSLKGLWVYHVSIGLVLPTHLNISSSLKSLDLRFTGLKGKLPHNIFNLQYLEELWLSGNNDLTGPLPKVNTSIPLQVLYLSNCGLVGPIPKSLAKLRQLTSLSLSSNKLNGTLPSRLFFLQSLKGLYLANNKLSGHIDVLDQGAILQTFQRLTNLISLDLSNNNFRGNWESDALFSSLTNLVYLDLSYSGVSVMTNNLKHYVNPMFRYLGLASCKIKVFPEFLQHMKNLQYLNLSNNQIQGSLPQSICNMNSLSTLDVSDNNFGGVIPKCFGNTLSSLYSINLKNNHFQGTIPYSYYDCMNLEGFILNGNQFEGEVPSFLSKCHNLKVLDLGNNYLNGTFPYWSRDLPNLQVLILKSNNFHGPIVTFSTDKLSFQSLQVLDLSHNGFVGQLPENYFRNFEAMKIVVKDNTSSEYLKIGGMYYSVTITIKGSLLDAKIFVHNTIIDVSHNGFQGEIPNIISSLKSLKSLNLSHNNFSGRIPHSLGNLSEIESLDLSWNQLTGEIPRDLENINGLARLNLSQNHLVGRIPEGTQFTTFDVSSFGGNSGLCGFPLPKCESSNSQQYEVDGHYDDDEIGCTWKVVLLGYGCGILIGSVLGYLMLSTKKPKWFNEISDSIEQMIMKRINKRRSIYTRK